MKSAMKKTMDNEEGYILVLSMFLLMILTILGVSATNTSTIEILMAKGARHYQENFYEAEAAAMEGAAMVRDAAIDPAAFNWLNNSADLAVPGDLRDETNYTDANSAVSSLSANARYLALNRGVVPGDSLLQGAPSRTDLRIYGRYNCDSGAGCGRPGEVMVELGYLK